MAKVTGRRLFKLEWAAYDARMRRRPVAAKAAELGLQWPAVRAELHRNLLIYALGLWPQAERQSARQRGCTVAELRRNLRQLSESAVSSAKRADSARPGLRGDQPHAV